MDIITKRLIVDFTKTQELTSLNEPDSFELFCNYSIVSNEYNKTFNIESINVGSGQDTGIDGIAIIVNGHIIEELDEIDDLLTSNGYLDVSYIFIQAKTSSSFDSSEMHKFYFGIQDFFSETPRLPRNNEITHFSNLSNHILSHAPDFKSNPKCKMYYVTTGTVNEEDENLNAVNSSAIQNLRSLNLFEKVESFLLGANEIGKLYRKTKNPISSTFVFANKVTLQDIEGISESHFGILPFSEFKKFLVDDNDNINSVFDDNVRDFQGINNPVNKSISATLSDQNPNLFSVLNNGVTIVADSIKTSGNTFTINDYQIVNGCQTSNVLFEHRHSDNLNSLNIPVRLIVTNDDDVKSKITVSTNNQTAIKKEQLTAMSDFQKNLEHFYASIEGDGRLYYERRAKQYSSNRAIVKRRIITVSNQIKSFSSMFMKNPHLVTSYYGTIVKRIGNSDSKSPVFNKNHKFSPYYLSGLAYYRLDSLFNSNQIDSNYRKVKFFVLMVSLSFLSEDSLSVTQLTSARLTDKFCNPIITKLNDPSMCLQAFSSAVELIDASGVDINDKQFVKSGAMTKKIFDMISIHNSLL